MAGGGGAAAEPDFLLKVLGNARALLEHSAAALGKVEAWRADLGAWMRQDAAALAAAQQAGAEPGPPEQGQPGEQGPAGGRGATGAPSMARLRRAAADMDALVSALPHRERYRELGQVLVELGCTSVPRWMNASLEASDGESAAGEGGQGAARAAKALPDKVLLDYVVTSDIAALGRRLEAQARQLAAEAEGVREAERAVGGAHLRVLHELGRLLALPFALEGDASRGFADAAAELDRLVDGARGGVERQRQLVQLLQDGADALVALHELLEQEQQLGVTIAAHAEVAEQQRRLFAFSAADVALVAGAGAGVASALPSPPPPIGDTIKAAVAQSRAALKAVAALVEQAKPSLRQLLDAKQGYPASVGTAVVEAVEAARLSADAAERTAATAAERCALLANESLEFSRLRDIYRDYQGALSAVEGEVRRRWAALAAVEKRALEMQAEVDAMAERELEERTAFQERHGRALPAGLCPALAPGLRPTSMQFVVAEPDDAQLLHSCILGLEASRPLEPPRANS